MGATTSELQFCFISFRLVNFIISIAGQVIASLDSIVSFSIALASMEAQHFPFQWLGTSARQEVSNGVHNLARV